MTDRNLGLGPMKELENRGYGRRRSDPLVSPVYDAQPTTEERAPASLYEKGKVRLSLDVSPELNELLESLSRIMSVTKSDVLRKAIVLMKVALDAKMKKQKLAIVDNDQPVQTEIVGLF
jgi:hypothetical protein